MPLLTDFKIATNCPLAIWKLSESIDELTNQISLNSSQLNELQLRQSEVHKKGFLGARNALAHLNVSIDQLTFSNEGVPLIPNQFCSLSHSNNYAAAVINKDKVGIDIEAHREKIVRIASKFVHPKEALFIYDRVHKIELLTRLWTAKEAIYKCVQHKGLAFASQIQVEKFDLEDVTGNAQVIYDGKKYQIDLHFSTFDNHQLTLAQYVSK